MLVSCQLISISTVAQTAGKNLRVLNQEKDLLDDLDTMEQMATLKTTRMIRWKLTHRAIVVMSYRIQQTLKSLIMKMTGHCPATSADCPRCVTLRSGLGPLYAKE